jgi:hypothetical protein
MTRLVCLAAGLIISLQAQDAAEIVRRSVERDFRNFERLQNYTFLERTEERRVDKKGNTTSTSSETEEVLILAGRPYYRLVARDDKPLSEKDARKEQDKLDKELHKRLQESEKDKAKRAKERAEERRYLAEIPSAFTLTILGEDQVDGHAAWKIRAEPKPGYDPKDGRAKVFKKVRGTLWIEQADYEWVKADIEVIDTISWGLFVLRIPPGARISFEQTRINDEVWLPKEGHVRADAKLGLLKTFRMGLDITYRDYRKFSSESQLVGAEEVLP